MAETRDITITIKGENGGGGNNSANLNVNSKTSVSSTVSEGDNGDAIKSYAMSAVISVAKDVLNDVVSTADFQMTNYMNLQDDYIGQRQQALAQQVLSGVTNRISSTVNGALSGFAVGGPVGAAIGAAVGLFTSISKQNKAVLEANAQQNIQLQQLDLQLQYTRRRAGWSTHAASIGEDL